MYSNGSISSIKMLFYHTQINSFPLPQDHRDSNLYFILFSYEAFHFTLMLKFLIFVYMCACVPLFLSLALCVCVCVICVADRGQLVVVGFWELNLAVRLETSHQP